MGHVDRVDKNVALAAIRLHRCKLHYHRQLFFWLLSAVGFNNVFVLFMFIFAAAVEFQTRNENNDFGWKHWFQLELSLVLMKRGRHMCDVQRRNKAVRVLISFVRSGSWKTKWRAFHANHCSCCPHASADSPPTCVVTPPASASGQPRTRGRPTKSKRGSGGGANKRIGSPPAKATTKKVLKQRRLQRERLETYAFQSPPPFAPRSVGRKRKAPVGDTVFVNGKQHTLVHSSTLKKWKTPSSFCVCCYSRAPPPSTKGRKKFMSDGSRIPQTSFACNMCYKRLCKHCHHHVYPPHLKGDHGVPRDIVYINEIQVIVHSAQV